MAKSKKDKEQPEKTEPVGLAALRAKLVKDYPEAMTAQVPDKVVSTGSLCLDKATGIGGLPYGRIVEIYGPESAGKTTLMLSVCAQAQKQGEACVYVDYEHALSPAYALQLGVDMSPEKFLWVQPKTLEEGTDIIVETARSKAAKCIVIDSIAAAVPKAELEGESGDTHIGLQARLISQFLKRATGVLSENKVLLLIINQLRHKVGVIYGSPEVTPGGNALKFYASLRLDIRRKEQLKDGEEIIGIRCRVRVKKNKMANPETEGEFNVIFGKGIDQASELLVLAEENGTVVRQGAWYSVVATGERMGQGELNAIDWLNRNKDRWGAFLWS